MGAAGGGGRRPALEGRLGWGAERPPSETETETHKARRERGRGRSAGVRVCAVDATSAGPGPRTPLKVCGSPSEAGRRGPVPTAASAPAAYFSLLARRRYSPTVMAFFWMLYCVKRPDWPVTTCWMGAGMTTSSMSSYVCLGFHSFGGMICKTERGDSAAPRTQAEDTGPCPRDQRRPPGGVSGPHASGHPEPSTGFIKLPGGLCGAAGTTAPASRHCPSGPLQLRTSRARTPEDTRRLERGDKAHVQRHRRVSEAPKAGG